MQLEDKLAILADSAKYDVACTSSGVDRAGVHGKLGNEVFIPNGDFVLLGGDRISVASKADVAAKFFKRISVSIGKSRDVILLGGGKISFYLAKNLIASGASVKIIEKNSDRCWELT